VLNPVQTTGRSALTDSLAAILSVILACLLAFHFSGMLGAGAISLFDEYYTYDRSIGFAKNDDWLAVFTGNIPSFKKPPLQYWMTAGFMASGLDHLTALRLPSLIFAVLTLLNVGLFAFLLYPRSALVAPAAVLLLASSQRFWEYALSAMLDMGATFFANLSLTAFLMALRQPKWWYLVAIAIGLGAWQKAPIGLILVGGMLVALHLTRRFHDIDTRKLVRTREFRTSFYLTLFLLLLWPLIQVVRFGPLAIKYLLVDEMLDRFSPFGVNERKTVVRIFGVITDREPLVRIAACISLFCLPFLTRRRELIVFPIVFLLFVASVILASGETYPRYSLIFLPMLLASLAVCIFVVARFAWLALLLVVGVSLLYSGGGGPFRSADSMPIWESSQTRLLPLFRSVEAAGGPDETIILCRGGGMIPGAVSVYSAGSRRMVRLETPQQFRSYQARGRVQPPYRGLCSVSEMQKMERILDGFEIVETSFGVVHWTSANPVRAAD